jgi:serine/threonine protein kinase
MERDRHSRAAGSADPSASQDAAVGKLLHEYLERRACGQAESQADFLAAHPELADELRLHLSLVRSVFDGSGTLHGLIRQGVLRVSSDPRFPAELGPYKISALLGRGGMGIVLLAHEESLNRRVALKILRPDLGDDPVALARFTREAKAAAGLRHPNIVDIHAVGQERGVHYLAMEYIEGPTLAEVLRRAVDDSVRDPSDETACACESLARGSIAPGPASQDAVARPPVHRAALPTDTIRTLFRQLLRGLAAAHGAGLVHRDIKSSNLLLDFGAGQTGVDRTNPAPATLKIADFGLARMVVSQTRLTLEARALGTPEYMSPEQARGDEAIDRRADLYSAGVVLYEMLTGRTPFRDATPTGIIHRILHDEPAHPRTRDRGADPALASLALRLMAKRPEDRFATAEEALTALDAGTTVGSRERRRRWRRRAAAAIAVLAVVIGAAWMLTGAPAVGPVQEVWVEKSDEGMNTLTILARYGQDAQPRVFYRFPHEAGMVADVTLIDLDGRGRRAGVAVLNRPLNGDHVFVIDDRGTVIRRIGGLSDDQRWPDVNMQPLWTGVHVVAGDVDGHPGDEVIVTLADHSSYASQISCINPRTERVLSTFWHLGHVPNMLLCRDFFRTDQGARPGLIAWGIANKLDGFGHESMATAWHVASWNLVSVVMVLDPLNMTGLGPPPTDGFGDQRPRAPVYAYAMLNAPPRESDPRIEVRNGRLVREPGNVSRPADVARIEYVTIKECSKDGPCIDVGINARESPSEWGAVLELNRYLEVTGYIPSNDERSGRDSRQLWKPIVREGKDLVGEPPIDANVGGAE